MFFLLIYQLFTKKVAIFARTNQQLNTNGLALVTDVFVAHTVVAVSPM